MGNSPSPHRCLRLLHLEDNARDAKLCRIHLEQAGFELQTDVATSWEDFTKFLSANSYDIILADYSLPDCTGLDALDILQREKRDIPFILVTGTIQEETAVECFKSGATDYVVKDRMARLPYAVQRALDERDARAERRGVERSRDLLASIVESSDYGIVGMDLDGTILTWNRGAEQIYGYSSEEMQGKSSSVLFAADGADELRQETQTLQGGGSVSRREIDGVTKNGRAIQLAVTMSPIRYAEGHLTGVSAIIRDITEQKRLQREFVQAQKMEGIGRLAAGIAHDFNNLLTVITGYTSSLLSQLEEHDPMHTDISEVEKAGERAATLTRQLLAFSKKQILQPRLLNLNDSVIDMNRMLSRVIGEDIELVTILPPTLGCVYADPGQIEQVIMNLAVNARDAMPHGGTLTVETEDANVDEILGRHLGIAPGPYVRLAVTDTGLGMDAQTQAQIFEPFFTTKGIAGTGLGLSTVYGIVHQSGGVILVRSELRHGSTFQIYLPRRDDALMQTTSPAVAGIPKGSETILVVEDEDAVRNMICALLKKQGYVPLAARSGREALLLFEQRSEEIALMITDVVMPSMNGGDLAARIKSFRPDIKVLFISGYADDDIVHQAVLKSNTAFLGKPFTPPDLARKVRDTLDRKGG